MQADDRSGLIVITTFISPLRSQRDSIRSEYDQNRFIEVFIDTPLQICEERDVKGLYKSQSRRIKNFTGIDSPYEVPLNAELIIKTEGSSENESAQKLIDFVMKFIRV